MKKRIVIAVTVIIVISIAFSLFGYNWYRGTQVDTSWVNQVNVLLKDYYANDTEPPLDLTYLRAYLVDNGTDKRLYYPNGTAGANPLLNYLTNLLQKASLQKGTISNTDLNQELETSRAIELSWRTFIEVQSQTCSHAYFILSNNLNPNLNGEIIVKETYSGNLSIIAISKLPPLL